MVGDSSFTGDGLAADLPLAGIHPDVDMVREQQRWIQTPVAELRMFPSHDPAVAARLLALDQGP
jgi:hypothetical protein